MEREAVELAADMSEELEFVVDMSVGRRFLDVSFSLLNLVTWAMATRAAPRLGRPVAVTSMVRSALASARVAVLAAVLDLVAFLALGV